MECEKKFDDHEKTVMEIKDLFDKFNEIIKVLGTLVMNILSHPYDYEKSPLDNLIETMNKKLKICSTLFSEIYPKFRKLYFDHTNDDVGALDEFEKIYKKSKAISSSQSVIEKIYKGEEVKINYSDVYVFKNSDSYLYDIPLSYQLEISIFIWYLKMTFLDFFIQNGYIEQSEEKNILN